MNFEWEEIHNNEDFPDCDFFETTFRAEVIGGWLIRHQTESSYKVGHGYQRLANTMVFIRDPNHEWGLE